MSPKYFFKSYSYFEGFQILGLMCMYDYLEFDKNNLISITNAFNKTYKAYKNKEITLDGLIKYNKSKGLNVEQVCKWISAYYRDDARLYLLLINVILRETIELKIGEIHRFNNRMIHYYKQLTTLEPGGLRQYMSLQDVVDVFMDEINIDIRRCLMKK